MSADTTPTNETLGEPPPLVLAPGVVLNDRWRLDRCVASGGYGDVWSAEDLGGNLGRVAAKILRRDAGNNDPSALARMRLEAEILSELNHPNLVEVHGFFESNYGPFLVMEFLEGEALDQSLQRIGAADPVEAISVVRQLLSALEATHSRGVLHRDIKPENIVLVEGSTLSGKLIDFGIAKTRKTFGGGDDSGLTLVQTRAGGFMGTPRYSAPEQVVGDPIGPSADIFSLGLVVAEWLTGTPRLSSESHSEVMSQLLSSDPLVIDDVPYRWKRWLQRCIAKIPEKRFQSADEAAQALENWVVKEGKPADFLDDGYFPGGQTSANEGSNFVGREHGPLELDLDRIEAQRSAAMPIEEPGESVTVSQPERGDAVESSGRRWKGTPMDAQPGAQDLSDAGELPWLAGIFVLSFAVTFLLLSLLLGAL